MRRVTRTERDDCSGFTRLAYSTQPVRLMDPRGLPNEGGVQNIYRRARYLGALTQTPRRGDLVFFRETYDRNRDGLVNDGLTHIGIVEEVEPNGTVVFLHRATSGVKRSRLNVASPTLRKDENGDILNDWLRKAEAGRPGRFAGELVVGYARIDDRWRS